MAEKTTINFRGQEVTLKFPLLAIQRLEETGVSLSDLGEDDTSISTIIKVVWAGLSCEFRDADIEEIAMSFEMSDLEALSAAINEGFSAKGK